MHFPKVAFNGYVMINNPWHRNSSDVYMTSFGWEKDSDIFECDNIIGEKGGFLCVCGGGGRGGVKGLSTAIRFK